MATDEWPSSRPLHVDALFCVDISLLVLSLAQKRLSELPKGANVIYMPVDNFDADSKCDFAYSFQVMQHNPEHEQKAIAERIYSSLKPGGLACIHMPSLENHPGYRNSDTCRCFNYQQAEEMAKMFDKWDIEMYPLAEATADYLIWGRKHDI